MERRRANCDELQKLRGAQPGMYERQRDAVVKVWKMEKSRYKRYRNKEIQIEYIKDK